MKTFFTRLTACFIGFLISMQFTSKGAIPQVPSNATNDTNSKFVYFPATDNIDFILFSFLFDEEESEEEILQSVHFEALKNNTLGDNEFIPQIHWLKKNQVLNSSLSACFQSKTPFFILYHSVKIYFS